MSIPISHATFAVDLLPLLTGGAAADSIWLMLVLIVVGLYAITKGGDLFTDSSVELSELAGIPPAIVGATVVSTATSFPEFMVSVTGTVQGATEFAVGNAIGSCICNIGLVVGLCAVTQGYLAERRKQTPGIVAERSMLTGAGFFMLLTAALTLILSVFDAGAAVSNGTAAIYGMARWQGGLLLVVMCWYLVWSIRMARRERIRVTEEAQIDASELNPSWGKTMFIFCTATVVIAIGSRLMVANGEGIALRMGVPRLVLGLTLFAIGTSLPELIVSLMAVLKGHQALGLGNVIGSNVMNISWVLATCAAFKPLPIERQTVFIDLPVTLFLTVLLLVLPWKSNRITSKHGWMLLAVYAAHLVGMAIYTAAA